MQTVKVNKTDLIQKLLQNRIEHSNQFGEANNAFRERVRDELYAMISDLSENKPARLHVNLPVPVDHTKDYDRVISMLQMSISTEIELQAHEFDQYVLDDWSWKQNSLAINSTYLGR